MKYLSKIPKAWDEVKVKDYQSLVELIEPDAESTELVEAAFYVFTGVPMPDAGLKIDEINAIVTRLTFVGDVPTEGNNKLKVKEINNLTYDDYIKFQKLAENPMQNLIEIVKIFSIDPINDNTLSMSDALGCFFLLNQKMKKRLMYLAISSIFHLLKMKVKTLFNKIFNKIKMSFTRNGVG